MKRPLKTKKSQDFRDFSGIENYDKLTLRHGAQAASADRLSGFLPTFKKGNFLKIGAEFSIRRAHGKTAVVAKNSFLSANFTRSHDKILS